MLTWAITRAAHDAHALVDQLITEGLHAVSVPCIERTFRAVAPWRPPGHRVVVLTSASAVEAVAAVLAASSPAEIAALVPATVEALSALSPPVKATITSTEGVVALAAAIVRALDSWNIRAASFWYPTSSAGFAAPEQHDAIERLSVLGPVTRVAAYDVSEPSGLSDQLRALPENVGVVFSSPSSVKHFVRAGHSFGVTRTVRVAACWGASTKREADAHFTHTHLLPRSQSLADSLRALENDHV